MSKKRRKGNNKPNTSKPVVNNTENTESSVVEECKENTNTVVNEEAEVKKAPEEKVEAETKDQSEETVADEKKVTGKKAKKRLGVIFLKEDEETGLEKKLVEPDKVQKITELTIAVFVALAMVAVMFCIRFVALDRTVRKLNNVIEDMSSQTLALTRENAELSEKVSLLSNQVAVQMVVDEQTEAKKVPNGLPISGKVQVISEPEDEMAEGENAEVTDEEAKEPMVIFGVEDGSKVMASGNGVVAFVGYDEEFVYRVEIDHDNGYTSVYRYAGEPKVREGDEVLRAQLLFEVTGGGSVVGYQIIKDEEFVDPMTVMEING